MNEIIKIYGPYMCKDGRRRMMFKNMKTGERSSTSYARWLYQEHYGVILDKDEVVDHINEDASDDRIENFQILSYAENNRKSAPKPETIICVCPECDKEFEASMRRIRSNQNKKGQAGPFCGKSCAGKYGAKVQNMRT